MNVAKKFYAKRIKKIKLMTSRETEEMFSEKKRYYIVKKNLSKNIQYRNLYEVGGGGFSYLSYINNNYKILKVTGIDLHINKKICKYKSINYIAGDFDGDFPVKNNTVQILIIMMVIEHLFDPFKSFKKVFDLLSDDGIAFINLPLVSTLKNRFKLLFGNLPETSISYDMWFKNKEYDGNHLHYFTIRSIEDLCKISGLEIVDRVYCGNFQFLKKIRPELFASEISFMVKKIKKK
jgi:SAM-dependent methyltransferase